MSAVSGQDKKRFFTKAWNFCSQLFKTLIFICGRRVIRNSMDMCAINNGRTAENEHSLNGVLVRTKCHQEANAPASQSSPPQILARNRTRKNVAFALPRA